MSQQEDSIAKELYKTQENDEPFIIGDLGKITQRYNMWTKYLPNVELFYAVKANDEPMILEHIRDLGAAGFECASLDEIKCMVEMGISPEKIIFMATQKFPSHIKISSNYGVEMLAFDSEPELRKIKKYYNGTPKLILRIVSPLESTSVTRMAKKFGCVEPEAKRLLKVAFDLEMDVYGISFHVGHCTEDPEPFVASLDLSKELYLEGKDLGHSMGVIDIGGGFPGPSEKEPTFIKISDIIQDMLNDAFPKDVRIIGEPGLFLVCNAFQLYMKVIGTRMRNPEEQDIFLNAGNSSCAGRDNFNFHSSKLEILDQTEEKCHNGDSVCSSSLKLSNIWGPTSDPRDWLAEMMLPELLLGTSIRMTNIGGYCLNRSDNMFCGYPNPKIFYMLNGQTISENKLS